MDMVGHEKSDHSPPSMKMCKTFFIYFKVCMDVRETSYLKFKTQCPIFAMGFHLYVFVTFLIFGKLCASLTNGFTRYIFVKKVSLFCFIVLKCGACAWDLPTFICYGD